jgi:hypothetical protein
MNYEIIFFPYIFLKLFKVKCLVSETNSELLSILYSHVWRSPIFVYAVQATFNIKGIINLSGDG